MSVNICWLMLMLADRVKLVKGKCHCQWSTKVQIFELLIKTVSPEKEVEWHQLSLQKVILCIWSHPISRKKKWHNHDMRKRTKPVKAMKIYSLLGKHTHFCWVIVAPGREGAAMKGGKQLWREVPRSLLLLTQENSFVRCGWKAEKMLFLDLAPRLGNR